MLVSPLQRLPILFAGGALLAGLAFAPLAASAAPLDQKECERLKAEKRSLAGLGVEKDMAKGPEWVKANLQASQLDLIKRYLTVDEQLKFRCHHPFHRKKKKVNAAAARSGDRKAATKAEAAKARKSGSKPASANAKPSGAEGG